MRDPTAVDDGRNQIILGTGQGRRLLLSRRRRETLPATIDWSYTREVRVRGGDRVGQVEGRADRKGGANDQGHHQAQG